MTNVDNLSIDELINIAEQTEDQSVTTAGGDFVREVPAAGKTVARFIEYVELGVHPQKAFKGKEKPDVEYVRIAFELNSPKHVKEIEIDGNKKNVANIISLTLAKKFGEKAAFKKLFNKMVYGRENIKHMARMLGEGFVIDLVHNTVGEGEDKKTYANMASKDGEWFISAPRVTNPLTDEITNIPVPEPLNPKRVFLWDNPNKPTWDSLFIDGTRTVKDEKGVEKEVSKNWLQQKVQSAKNYKGSPLDAMLGGVTLPTTDEAIKQEEKKVEDKKGEDLPAEDFDPMKALGL